MLKKIKMSIIIILCIPSIIGIGFSSWIIGTLDNILVNGQIDVDTVIESDDYILLTKEPLGFEYGERGFIDSNGNYVKKASFIVSFEINIDNCKKLFEDISLAYINIILTHSDNCVFNDNQGLFDSYVIDNGDPSLEVNYVFQSSVKLNNTNIFLDSSELKINDNEYSLNFEIGKYFNIDDNISILNLDIYYEWFIDDASNYFKNNIYPIIYDESSHVNKLTLSVSAFVTGN